MFRYDRKDFNIAGIAQLVEQRIRNAKVVGSILITNTIHILFELKTTIF